MTTLARNGRILLAWAVISTAALVAVLLSDLVAGGPRDRRAADALPARLVIWAYGSEAEMFHRVIAHFQTTHPGHEIYVQPKSWNEHPGPALDRLPPSARPDLIQVGSTWIGALVDSDLLEPMDAATAGREARDRFLPESWDLYSVGERLYAIPWYLDVRALYYRTDLIPDPPETWDQLLDISARLRENRSRHGRTSPFTLTMDLTDPHNFLMILWDSGGSLEEFDGPRTAVALERWNRIARSGAVPFGPYEETRDVEAIMASAYTVMNLSGPWNVRALERDFPGLSDDWATAALPRFDTAISFLGGAGWAIPKGAANASGARLFIEFMSQATRQAAWCEAAGGLPANRDAWSHKNFASPHLAGFRSSMARVRHPPTDPRWARTDAAWRTILRQALERKITSDEALTALRREAAWIKGKKP